MPLPSLATYRGRKLPVEVEQLLTALLALGFTVAPSGRANKTIRINWGTAYVAYVNETVLIHKGLIGYRFFDATSTDPKIPTQFDVAAFANERGCSPFALEVHQKTGGSYLHVLTQDAAIVLLRASVGLAPINPEPNDPAPDVEADLKAIASDTSVAETTRKALVQARIGQGDFRANLLQRFDGQCVVTRLRVPRLLRASHIKPWRLAKNDERLDPDNGLLLSPNVDALFDAGLITFDERGRIQISPRLDNASRASLGPIGDLLVTPTAEQAAYLLFHARNIFN